MSQRIRDARSRNSSLLDLLVVTLFGLPLITPLLRWTSVPCTHDGHLHYHRIAAMAHGWEGGVFLARWLPDLSFGYGFPFFIFREAPPLYLALFPHLVGLPLPASMNLFYIVCILASGWFMYLWVRDIFGRRSGIVSAVAYMAAPYLLIDALIRGNQPESMALALFPLILWAGRRFLINGTASSFLAASLSLALLALSHNISTLLFTPLLLLYLISVSYSAKIHWRSAALRLLLLFGLGLALAAFYLGPALLELDEIAISQSVSNRNNDFRFNFATLGEIFAPVKTIDPTLLNPPLLLRLGWVPALLALAGLVSLKWTRSIERRIHILFMALAAFTLLFMALPTSLPIWENLPLIEFVQFPWRFIGRAALPIAFLAGVPFAYIPDTKQLFNREMPLAPILTMAAVIILIVESIPALYPHICPEEAYPSINTVHTYEHDTGLVGIDPTGSYFPLTVKTRPEGSLLEEDYLAGRLPQRFDAGVLPADAVIERVVYKPLSAAMNVTSPAAFQARYLTFAYPGWKAMVDGEPVPITASDPEGLITFPVPAGEHRVEVSWGMTSPRAVLAAVSAAAAAAIIAVSFLLARQGRARRQELETVENSGVMAGTSDKDQEDAESFDIGESPDLEKSRRGDRRLDIGLLVAAGVGLLLFKVAAVDPGHILHRAETSPPVANNAEIVAGELLLQGYNLSQKSIDAGQRFDIDLAWTVLEPPAADYQSNVWLAGPEGMIWSDKETQRPRTYEETTRSRFWLPGQWVWDSREIELLDGTPPGRYDIVLISFDRDSLQPLTLLDPSGAAIGPEAVIGTIEVKAADPSSSVIPQHVSGADISGLTLVGYNQDREETSPGEPLLITLFWKKDGEKEIPDNLLELALVDDSGESLQQWLLPSVRIDFPPEDWPAGVTFRGQHLLRLEPGLEGGVFKFVLEDVELGMLRVSMLNRLFEEPAYDAPLNANFDDLVELVGLSVEPFEAGQVDPFDVTIVWRALAEMPQSYRVFVHLLNEEGEILSQSDAEPAGWKRPTTGWLPEEYILDSHSLDPFALDAGETYTLRIGLYDPLTGLRLTTSGEEFVTKILN